MSGECFKCHEHPVDCECINQWVACSDVLPNMDDMVLGWDGNRMHVCQFLGIDYDNEVCFQFASGPEKSMMTHWQSLPKAPEAREDDDEDEELKNIIYAVRELDAGRQMAVMGEILMSAYEITQR